jgi:hypothetical protein
MNPTTMDLLKKVIDMQHGGDSAYLHSVATHRFAPRPGLWDGVVHVFQISGNAHANKAYAWASPIEGTTHNRFFAVLHQGAVRGPVEAVQAVLKAIRAAA